MKNSFLITLTGLLLTACGGQQNSSESANKESLNDEILSLDSIAVKAETVNQEITEKAERLDSLIKNLNN